MFEVIFLFGLALIWIVFATVEDLRTREIFNWLNFSLIIFALGFRFFFSLFSDAGFQFFYQGLIGFGIFFVLSNLFYYGKMFAGGDSKLFMALGAILPISNDFFINLEIFGLFILLFLICGAIYGVLISLYLGIKNFKNFKKEFSNQLRQKKKFVLMMLSLACVFLIGGFFISELFSFGVFIFIIPYFYLYVKSVDEACMVKKVKVGKLTEGDWLYEDILVGKKKIKATWDGLTREDLELLMKKKKEVLVRYGIQFGPVFLFSFVLLWLNFIFGWFLFF